MGRASRLRHYDGLHARCPVLYSAACIFRVLPNCFSPSMTPGISSLISLAIASRPGPAFAPSACSPAAPPLWMFAAIAARHLNAPTSAFSARVVSQKPAVPVASKPRSSGYPGKVIFCPTETGSTLPLLCLIYSGPSSSTTSPCSTPFAALPPAPCYAGPADRAWRSVSSAPAHLCSPAQPASAHSPVRH